MLRRWIAIIRDFMRQQSKKNIGNHAASAAFFILLSFIPMLLLVCAILPYTPISKSLLLEVVVDIMPNYIDPIVVGIIDEVYAKSFTTISFSALAALWSAGKGILALMQGLNVIHNVQETRNYVMVRIKASLYTVAALVVVILSLTIMVFGNILGHTLFKYMPQLEDMVRIVLSYRTHFAWLIFALVFMVAYTWIPNAHLKFTNQFIGAAGAAFVWNVFSWGFSLYISRFGGFGMYGSLSTIIAIMLWMYFCSYIMLMGAAVNQYLQPVLELRREERQAKKALAKS